MAIRQPFIAVTILVGTAAGTIGMAEPVTYNIDPSHTFPAFEADHWGGLSVWRGKINRSSGTVVLDKEAGTGSVEVEMDMASIDFGHDAMNERTLVDIIHVDQFPTATYTGTLVDFEDGEPTAVEGTLTLHGVSQPVNLQVNRFQCQPPLQAYAGSLRRRRLGDDQPARTSASTTIWKTASSRKSTC